MAWYSHHFRNLPLFFVLHTVKGFSVFRKVEVDVFLSFTLVITIFLNLSSKTKET